MEDTEGDLMLLLKDTDESIKEGVVHIISKAGASFREQADDSILSRYLMRYIKKYSTLFSRVLLNLNFSFIFLFFLLFNLFFGFPFLIFPPFYVALCSWGFWSSFSLLGFV